MGNYFNYLTSDLIAFNNKLEQDKIKREEGNLSDENKKLIKGKVYSMKKELFKIAMVIMIESLIIFLYINPVDYPITYKNKIYKVRAYHLQLLCIFIYLLITFSSKTKEIQNYFNRKVTMILNYTPKTDQEAKQFNYASDTLYRSSAQTVYRISFKFWFPMILFILWVTLESKTRLLKNPEFIKKSYKAENYHLYEDFHTPITESFYEIGKQFYRSPMKYQ